MHPSVPRTDGAGVVAKVCQTVRTVLRILYHALLGKFVYPVGGLFRCVETFRGFEIECKTGDERSGKGGAVTNIVD
jgi:hypothetical protein